MQNMNNLLETPSKEARRIEEDSIHSAKSHFNAVDIWNKRHYWLGITNRTDRRRRPNKK